MYIELYVNGEKKRIWQHTTAKSELNEYEFNKREEELELIVSNCKEASQHLINNKDYVFYAVMQSKLHTIHITEGQQNLFNKKIKKNDKTIR
jgi:IS1 family transposase